MPDRNAKKPCFDFARGECTRGNRCKYSHEPTSRASPGPCPFYLTPNGCYRGKQCKFLHELGMGKNGTNALPQAIPRPRERSGIESSFREWTYLIPKRNTYSRSLVVDTGRFFKMGWDLMNQENTETRQQIITKLATEEGIAMIKALVDLAVDCPIEEMTIRIFKERTLPFFQTISHPDVLSSLILETPLDTICTFLFGPNGRRAIDLFKVTAVALTALALVESLKDDELSPIALTASLAVLQRIVDLNQSAQVIADFTPIADTISACIPEQLPLYAVRRSLARIRHRLGLGTSMASSENRSNKLQNHRAVFELGQDLPGMLSEQGPRHDNDHENIRDIKILPTAEEIQSHRLEYLPSNDPTRNHLPGLEGLLDRQFRLLREDTIGQLRDAVHLELERLNHPSTVQSKPNNGARNITYHKVHLLRLAFDRRKGLQIVAEFEQPPALRKKGAAQREEWWKSSKQLQIDALLCLVSSTGNTIFFSVCDPVPTPPPKKRNNTEEGLATPSTGLNTDPGRAVEHPSLFKHADRATVMLSMLEDNMEDVTWINNHLGKAGNLRQSLVEFPGILLPSFRPTLQALQQMSRTLDLPFSEFIAPVTQDPGVADIPPPAYSRGRGFAFSLDPLTGGEPLKLKPGKQFDYQMLRSKSTLDDAQQISTVNALSRCLALIQGPPGTGKSYTGVAIIKTLLKNRKAANLGPIVCVCYTNHALDQLLEHLVKDGVEQLIRLGSRSKSELLQDLNLRHVSQQVGQTKTEGYEKWQLHTKLDSELAHIEEILQGLKDPTSWRNIKAYLERQDSSRHFEQLFGMGFDEDGFRTVRDRKYSVVKSWLRGAAQRLCSNRPVTELSNVSLLEMSASERESIHKYWVQQRAAQLNGLLLHVLESYRDTKDELEKCYQELNLRCLLRAHVIGVTTTGLARNLEVLRRVRAKVMVCEEAGEVLEAHTLTALLPSVEHAILIGDHEQLRPQINNYELQHDHPRGGKFSLDISLFERLVKPQPGYPKIPFSSLKVQRRMHPSIAELVRTTLYPELQDYASVLDYPEVDGLRKRLFWLNHQEKEDSSSSAQMISFSKTNSFEVEMVAALVSHLVRQGTYGKDDIAVLTPYLGQLQKIKQRLRSSFEIVVGDRDLQDLETLGLKDDSPEATTESEVNMQKTTLLNALRVATVDNFQGEEAKVIVISLVRSNDERKCGFLKTSNRINVLLSRARHGMYIIGNAQTASSVPMWTNVISILERDKNIGQTLALCCPRHKETSIEVSKADDFSLLSPEGGCDKKCTSRLRCGHACINKCHADSLHNAVRCLERCQRIKRGCEHPCPRPCGDPCEAECPVQIPNIVLPCGHIRKWLECHKAQAPETVSCRIKVEMVMPNCKHRVKIRCCDLPLQDDYPCPATCGAALACGHDCKHACKDCNPKADGQISQRAHGICKAQCSRPYTTCSHACLGTCHGDGPCPLCNEPCEVRCSHSRCSKKCQEPCMPCVEDCSWSCPHRGKCQMPCAVPCDLLPCSKRCSEILGCGHRCPSVCGEVCPGVQHCQECADTPIKEMMVDYIMGSSYAEIDLDESPCIIPSCGHILTLESMDGHMSISDYYTFSDEPDGTGSIVGLKSSSEPFSIAELKNCPMCRCPLRNINRYGRIVRRAWIDEATKKFIVWANMQFVPLVARMEREETELREGEAEGQDPTQQLSSTLELLSLKPIQLKGSRDQQIKDIASFARSDARFKSILKLRKEVKQYLKKVDEAEQPLSRIHDLVQDARRHRGVDTEIFCGPNVLQVRNRLLATVLLLRCDYAILVEFLTSGRGNLHVNLISNRKDCEALVEESQVRQQPANAVEGLLYWARFVALERGRSEAESAIPELLIQARAHLQRAKSVCAAYPGQTAGMLAEIGDVEKMLRDSTFYAPVSNEEKAAVYAAMSQDFRGTGHWYYCANGHPFTIGDCGMPMQTSQCPQCGSPVGGHNHQAVEGVTRATDLEAQFSESTIRR